MATFNEANQSKLSLKMILSNYAWYKSIAVLPDGDDWIISVNIAHMNNNIRKIIPIVHKDISVKADIEFRKR